MLCTGDTIERYGGDQLPDQAFGSPLVVLAFAGACLASSAYGFLQGAWPFGVVEFVWSGVALRR